MRVGKPKIGECAYCGQQRELTDDHVPPKAVFSKPRPSLITVPSCHRCNKEFQKDDEYFQLIVKAGIDAERYPKEVADSVKSINQLARPESRGFLISLMEKYQRNPSRHQVEGERIGKTLYHTLRGLFYHHVQVPLAQSVEFRFLSIEDSPEHAREFSDVIPVLTEHLETIGDGVFRYAFFQLRQLSLSTMWLMTFYDHKRFLCFTISESDKADIAGRVPE